MAENIKQLNIGNETYNLDAYNADYAAEAGNSDKLEGYNADAIVFREGTAYSSGAPIRLNGIINGVADGSTSMSDIKYGDIYHSQAYLSRQGSPTVGYVDDIKNATLKNQVIYYVAGPSTDKTAGTWTGTIPGVSAYYDGLSVLYVPAVAGASTTKLNINGLGAKTCYYNNTSKLTTQYAVGTPILLTYIGGYWKRADYNSNTDTKVTQNAAITTDGDYPIILAYSTGVTTVTNAVNKTDSLLYNPNTERLSVPNVDVSGKLIVNVPEGVAEGIANANYGIQTNASKVVTAGSDPVGFHANVNGYGFVAHADNSVKYIALEHDGLKTYMGGIHSDNINFHINEKGEPIIIPVDKWRTKLNIKDYASEGIYVDCEDGVIGIDPLDGLYFNDGEDQLIIDLNGTPRGTETTKQSWQNWLRVPALDNTNKIPSDYLPAYVDDVIEGIYKSNTEFLDGPGGTTIQPVGSVIYVDITTNKTYRWSGSAYVEISASLALGTTASTAAKGNHTHTINNHNHSCSSVQPSFTGTAVTSGANSGNGITVSTNAHTHSVTASGTVGNNTAGATVPTITHTHNIPEIKFTGTAATHTHSFGATTSGGPNATVKVGSETHTHNIPALTFTGTNVNSYEPNATAAVYSSVTSTISNQRMSITFNTTNVAASGHIHVVKATGTIGTGTTGGPNATVQVGSSAHVHTTAASTTGSASITPAGTIGLGSGTVAGQTGAVTSVSGSTTEVAAKDHGHSFTGSAKASGAASTTSGHTAVVTPNNHTHSVTAAGTVGNHTHTIGNTTLTTNTPS